jgi:hypothetical protein
MTRGMRGVRGVLLSAGLVLIMGLAGGVASATTAGAAPTPQVTLTPAPYSFGNVSIGAGPDNVFSLTNNSTVTVYVNNITLLGSPAFRIVAGDCGGNLGGYGGSCGIEVADQPTQVGPESGTLTLEVNGTVFRDHLTATAVNPVTEVSLSPAPYSFGNVYVGGDQENIFTLTNNSDVTVNLNGISLAGEPNFHFDWTYCGNYLGGGGGNCVIAVSDQPTQTGGESGVLRVQVNNKMVTDQLSGTGINPATATSFSPNPYGFGKVDVGAAPQETFWLTNDSNVNVNLNNLGLSGSPAFHINGSNCYGSMSGNGNSCYVNVVDQPGQAGKEIGTLYIQVNGTVVRASLSGQGVNPAKH